MSQLVIETGVQSAAQAVHVRLRDVTKRFGAFTALNAVSLDINKGELICFLGPSGCGKTTLLRAIAGLDQQTSGTIGIGGRDVSRAPPAARDFGIVFQSYALFPNLTIADNVGYGLVNRRMSKADRLARVAELLTLVGLTDQSAKYASQLSGGQQQRVALARALATSPGLLLLDEPLSALDARVRLRLRDEIKALQRRLGVTTILVTHDQEEALSMADRIVVMNQGVIDQVGTPFEIYSRPATAFVADFIGTMNFIDGVAVGDHTVQVGSVALAVEPAGRLPNGAPVRLGFRPEEIRVRGVGAATPNTIPVRIKALNYLGAFCRADLSADAMPGAAFAADFSTNLLRDHALTEGMQIDVALPAEALRVFPATFATKQPG